ncbi:MAG: hypothetical protein AAB867_03580 [Patescibacteria group bacterium]
MSALPVALGKDVPRRKPFFSRDPRNGPYRFIVPDCSEISTIKKITGGHEEFLLTLTSSSPEQGFLRRHDRLALGSTSAGATGQ